MTQLRIPIYIFGGAIFALITKELVRVTCFSISPKEFVQIRAEEPPIEDIQVSEVPEEKSFIEKLSFWKDLCD